VAALGELLGEVADGPLTDFMQVAEPRGIARERYLIDSFYIIGIRPLKPLVRLYCRSEGDMPSCRYTLSGNHGNSRKEQEEHR
jgi:hypothetical protein